MVTETRRAYRTPAPVLSRISASHSYAPDNNENTPFEFSPENYEIVKATIAKYPKGRQQSAVMPLLDLAQRQCGGWLPLAAMNKVAKILSMAPMDVYEVASFYTMYNRTKVGKHFVQVCTTTPCMVAGTGAYKVMDAVKKHLGIEIGETTPDGLFTLAEVECLGACVNAPMMQIGDYFYEDLTPETAVKVLENLKAGVPVTPGPQCGKRKVSEGPLGKTTLLEEPAGPCVNDRL